MNTVLQRTITSWAAILAISCGVTEGGFNDPVDPPKTAGTTITGKALTAQGEPASGVQAYLLREGQRTASALSNVDGVFTLNTSESGRSTLVLNDGQGQGSIREMNIYADGENTTGDIFMERLEDLVRIVDIHGIGFEERLTTEAGNYIRPIYDSTASRVYALRRKEGEAHYNIVQITVGDGHEELLLEDQDLTSSGRNLTLIGDRVLIFEAYRPRPNEPEVRAPMKIAYDVTARAEIWSHETNSLMYSSLVLGDRAIFFEVLNEVRIPSDNPFGDDRMWQVRPTVIEGSSAQVRTGPQLQSGTGWLNSFSLLVGDNDQLIYSPVRSCFNYWDHPSQCDGDDSRLSVYRLDMATLTGAYLTTLNQLTFWDAVKARLTPAGDQVYYLHSERIYRLQLSTGTNQEIFYQPCTQGCPTEFIISPHGDKALLYTQTYDQQIGEHTSRDWLSLDLQAGTNSTLTKSATIDGTSYILCGEGSLTCEISYDSAGQPKLTEVKTETNGRRYTTTLVVTANGNVGRRFEIGERDGAPTIVSAGNVEAVLLRDLRTGFVQVHTGNPSAMTRRTFITAQHHSPAFSADGGTLYYFTRDPISGFEQLFRVVLAP